MRLAGSPPCAWLLALALLVVHARAETLVVFTSSAEPYRHAVEGIRQSMVAAGRRLTFLDLRDGGGPARINDRAALLHPSLIIAVGMEAWECVLASAADAPVLGSMILRADSVRQGGAARRRAAAIYLDVPLADLAAELAQLFPDKRRLGVIQNPANRGPAQPGPDARSRAPAFQVVECSRAEDLLRVFRSLKGKVDLVIALPDASLYNQATVKPLVLASLESGLPIIGFSSSFIYAGAAAGVYPDFHDIGHQTGDAAIGFLSGKRPLADEYPRKLQVATNQRVLRLFGLHASATTPQQAVHR